MKKGYARVKPKATKKAFGKAYIVAMILSATVCAFIFSFVFSPKENIPDKIEIDVPEISTEEVAQVSEPIEIEVPVTTETPKEDKPEIVEPEKTEEAGIFKNEEIKMLQPVAGGILNAYSGTKPVKSKTMGDWRVHSGIDIEAPLGTQVKAPLGGKVTASKSDKLTGNTVVIDHQNGFVSTLYNLQAVNVSAGEEVKEGQVIGTVGNSALLESAEAPHLHFELTKEGKLVNPKDYIK